MFEAGPPFDEHGPPFARLSALAQRDRYDLVRLLAGGERAANDLAAALRLPLADVLSHLGVLQAAGLVAFEARREGAALYSLRSAALYTLGGDLLRDVFDGELPARRRSDDGSTR